MHLKRELKALLILGMFTSFQVMMHLKRELKGSSYLLIFSSYFLSMHLKRELKGLFKSFGHVLPIGFDASKKRIERKCGL